ncbi:MAG: hypothetical protein AB8I08_06425 [Sandaracinaceae bacterium]
MRHVVMVLLCLLAAAPAAAQRRGVNTGWREVLHPDEHEARLRIREGLSLLVQAMMRDEAALGDAPDWLTLDHALLRFERARRVLPDNVDLAFYTAWALSKWEREDRAGNPERRDEEAIHAWHRVRELAPERSPDLVASQLAMLHTRNHELDLAIAEYERALAHAGPAPLPVLYRAYLSTPIERALFSMQARPRPALLHGNMAEVLMLAGALDAAALHYRRSVELAADSPFARVLAMWGLALALERAGDHNGALEWADRAMNENPIGPDTPRGAALLRRHGAFAPLHVEDVFFEPRCELHAYEAIGHEAIAARDVDPDPWALQDALASWRSFLTEGGVQSRFGAQARARIDALEPQVEALGEREPTRRRPRLMLTP